MSIPADRVDKFIDSDFHPADEPLEPDVTSDLLELLGATDAPKAVQRVVVGNWLAGNTPSALLLLSLRDDGLVD